MTKEARAFAEEFGGIWGTHPEYPLADWQYSVASDDTRSSYWDWVLGEKERNDTWTI
jgi:hypothetical protein